MRKHLSYANVTATLALVLAIAGGSTAIAVTVNASKKSDINKKGKIRAGRVTTPKIADGAVTAPKLTAIEIVQAQGITPRAICPAGSRLLGGGGRALTTERLNSSAPLSPGSGGDGWEASAGLGGATAYALCLRAGP
jgi:hypothetical protein